MKRRTFAVLVPVIGYVSLWILGTALFLLYFRVFNVAMQSDYVAMIRMVPAVLAIATVPICSFVSFYLTARILLKMVTVPPTAKERVRVAVISLAFTVAMDLITTVLIGRMNILIFPVNLMYLLAWAVIVPAVLLGIKKLQRLGLIHTSRHA